MWDDSHSDIVSIIAAVTVVLLVAAAWLVSIYAGSAEWVYVLGHLIPE